MAHLYAIKCEETAENRQFRFEMSTSFHFNLSRGATYMRDLDVSRTYDGIKIGLVAARMQM